MSESINFLRERTLRLAKKTRVAFLVQIGSLVILGLYVFVILILLMLLISKNKDYEALTNKVDSTKARLKELQPIETKQLYLASKAKSIAKIIPTKEQHQLLVKATFSLLPEGVEISNFSLSEGGGVSFTLQSSTFAKIEEFFDKINTFEDERSDLGIKIKQVDIDRVEFSESEKTLEKIFTVMVKLKVDYKVKL